MAVYNIDYSAILFLSQMSRNHTNVFRFSAELTQPVRPELLQKAADGIYTRFPTIFAGFRPLFFSYHMVPAKAAPRVKQDPGLLKTMQPEEITQCAYRIYYSGCTIIIELFHALTDGYGAIASLRTLVAEYLRLCYGVASAEQESMLQQGEPDWEVELQDSYLEYARGKSRSMPNRYSYQLPAQDRNWQVKTSVEHFSTAELLRTAKNGGVSLTSMLSAIMAEAIMELQQKHGPRKQRPVRIMVPADLRRMFPSKTLRNFVLYALPTMETHELNVPLRERMQQFHRQIRSQLEKDILAAQISHNVGMQRNLLFRMIPRVVKCGIMRNTCRFFGEYNSSITLTNLGPVAFSEELKQHIRHLEVHLTPRQGSPYNCGLLSCGDVTSISISRFGAVPELEPLFFSKLRRALES